LLALLLSVLPATFDLLAMRVNSRFFRSLDATLAIFASCTRGIEQ
jgi:hypothetical protein